jgi:hypothetical protein
MQVDSSADLEQVRQLVTKLQVDISQASLIINTWYLVHKICTRGLTVYALSLSFLNSLCFVA